jgi:hypothetical protein
MRNVPDLENVSSILDIPHELVMESIRNYLERDNTMELRTLNQLSYFDRVAGAFWFYNDFHSGQDSEGYEILCRLCEIYSPPLLHRGIHDDNEGALEHYNRLVDRLPPREVNKCS